MHLSGIIVLVVIGLVVVFLVSVRVEVAKQRRAVETARARLAAAKVRRRAEGVPVEVVLQTGSSMTHIARKSICALAEDGLYCLSEDGRWGARVPFGNRAPGIGEVALAAAPALIQGGKAVDAILPAWLAAGLASLPSVYGYGHHRDLHCIARRQRQMGIRGGYCLSEDPRWGAAA